MATNLPHNFDPATLALLSMYHGAYNSHRMSIADTDTLMELAKSFQRIHGSTNWEESEMSWEDSIIVHYNIWRPFNQNWNTIE